MTQSLRLPRWLRPPPARTAAFSSARSPGRRLASVPDPRGIDAPGVTQRVDERTHTRRDTREVAEEVEGGAFGGEDRRQRATHVADDGARGYECTLVGNPFDFDSFVDLTEGFGGAAGAGEHAGTRAP